MSTSPVLAGLYMRPVVGNDDVNPVHGYWVYGRECGPLGGTPNKHGATRRHIRKEKPEMDISVSTGGTNTTAGTESKLAFRRCSEGSVFVPSTLGTFAPFYTSATPLAGAALINVTALAEKGKGGTHRVLLRVKVRVPITNTNANTGNVTVANQEITLHVVLSASTPFVRALMGEYAIADSTIASPKEAAESGVLAAIAALVSILTNQTVDVAGLKSDLSSLPIYSGLLGICPLNEDSGAYGTTWLRPPATT